MISLKSFFNYIVFYSSEIILVVWYNIIKGLCLKLDLSLKVKRFIIVISFFRWGEWNV